MVPLPERRRGAEREQMREHVAHLVHEVDAQLVVVDADVDVHAADDETAHDLLKILLDGFVALLVGAPLLAPDREWMRGGSDEAQSVGTGDRRHGAAQVLQVGAGLADGGAHAGADLDLTLQELRRHLPFQQGFALRKHRRRRLVDEGAGAGIDEQVFLFDSDGEARLVHFAAHSRRRSFCLGRYVSPNAKPNSRSDPTPLGAYASIAAGVSGARSVLSEFRRDHRSGPCRPAQSAPGSLCELQPPSFGERHHHLRLRSRNDRAASRPPMPARRATGW